MRGKARLNFQPCLRERFLPDILAVHVSIQNTRPRAKVLEDGGGPA